MRLPPPATQRTRGGFSFRPCMLSCHRVYPHCLEVRREASRPLLLFLLQVSPPVRRCPFYEYFTLFFGFSLYFRPRATDRRRR